MGLPECAWDAGLGLVVLYRQGGALTGDLRLVVETSGRSGTWYAGAMPAGAPLWVVKVPRDGAFRLLFFPGDAGIPLIGTPPTLADGSPAGVAFDARLRVDVERPPGAGGYVGWLLQAAAAGQTLPCVMTRFTVGAEETLAEVLHAQGWDTGDGLGVTVMREISAAGGVTRGPALHPLRPASGALGVHFTLVPDPPAEAADAVHTPAFAELSAPAIAVDLSAFGEAAEALRGGLWFFHHPHGPERGVAHWSGADVPLFEDEHGGRYLLCTFDDACHLDLIGVAVVGGPLLLPRPDPGLVLHGAETHASGADCLLALYCGEAWLLPTTAAAPYATLARDYCAHVDLAAVTLARDAAWLGARAQQGAWQGAETAEGFTLVAFAHWLAGLAGGAGGAGAGRLTAVLARHGLAAPSFAGFAARADLLSALLAEPALAALLANAPPSRALFTATWLAPVAALAAALEPETDDLGAWVMAGAPDLQQALWRWLLVGGRATDWRALELTVAEIDDLAVDPAALAGLAQRVARARGPDPGGALAATAQDLGARLPGPPLRGLADALARADALAQASAALAREIELVNADLSAVPGAGRVDLEGLLAGFSAALAAGALPGRDTLRGRLLSVLGGLGPAALELAAAVTDLRTRAVLWGLAEQLGVATTPEAATGGAPIEFEPAPRPPMASANASAARQPAPALTPAIAPAPPQAPAPDLSAAIGWCLGVLQRADAAWPPADDRQAVDLDQGLADCMALLRELDAWWGLAEALPVAVPRWAGAQAVAARTMIPAIAGNGWQVRATLQGTPATPAREALIGILDRIVAAREYVVADALWADTRARLAAHPSADASLAALQSRMGLAAPDEWAALAAEADAYTRGQ